MAFLRSHPRLYAALLACVLVVIVFPDVVFLGASLRLTDQYEAALQGLAPVSVYPVAAHRHWGDAYSDTGGAVWQSEPMMEFMRRCWQTWNSPFWNPFSAAGSLGPETLVDEKFSAFTIAYMVLGGGSTVFNAVLLACYWLGTFFVIRVVREQVGLPMLSAVAAGAFYLLNGYSMANAGSNVAISYLFIPFCLYCAIGFAAAPGTLRFSLLALSLASMLSFTFFPTTTIALLTIFGIALSTIAGAGTGMQKTARHAIRFGIGAGAAMIAALAMLAIFYLPFVESLPWTRILEVYTARIFYPISADGIVPLFTPTHVFESYGAAELGRAMFAGNTVYHMGAVALCLAASAAGVRSRRHRSLVIGCAALMALALGRMYAVPGIRHLVELLPILRNIGCQYWWSAVAIPLVLLVGFGVEAVRSRTQARLAVAAVVLILAGATAQLLTLYGFHEPNLRYKLWYMAALAAALAVTCIVIWLPRPATRSAWPAALLVAMMTIELTAASKQLRLPVDDIFTHPPDWVKFVQDNIGPHRTLTIGAFGLQGERGSAYGIQEAASLNMGVSNYYEQFFWHAIDIDPAKKWGPFLSLGYLGDEPEKIRFNWKYLDLLGVKYILTGSANTRLAKTLQTAGLYPVTHDAHVSVFENPHVMPRAFVVAAAGDLSRPEDLSEQAGIAPARIETYRNDQVVIRGTADAPGLLVLTDNWHPAWRASVNGNPVAIARVLGTFRGVRVPAGEFEVTMHYRPATLVPALVISGSSTIGLVGALLFGAVQLSAGRRRRDSAAPSPAGAEAKAANASANL